MSNPPPTPPYNSNPCYYSGLESISVVWAILYILSLEKYFTKNQLPLLKNLNKRKSFVVRNSRSLVFYKKVGHKILSKFTCNLIKKETPTQVYLCEFSEILKKSRTPGNGWFWILHSFTSTQSNNRYCYNL